MDIKRNGTQPSSRGYADWFTGTVCVDPLFGPTEPARTGGATVTFEPGARTAWHTHPLGQTLIVIAGCGRVQCWGRSAVRAGRKTLARRRAHHRDNPHCHSGISRRHSGRVDGTR